jgi:ABC-2 type transport system ATP-binding protein
MLLRTEQLTKNYGRFHALDRLDLAVEPGEIFGLLGPNGAGKSTAIRLMLGFLQPTHGRALIQGFDCWQEGYRARAQVAYLPGELRLYENMTGRELVRFLTGLRGRADMPDLENLAAAFDIDISRPIAQLSSGMKRKVALLQVLLPKTPLLILDEPTNTLDPTMRDTLLAQLVRARAQGQAVLFSSHVLAEVEKVCDRVGILQGGRLVHVQKLSALREIRRIQATFDEATAGPLTLPDLPGVRQGAIDGRQQFTCEYEGPLPPLLGWLAERRVQDLRIEPLGLGRIYRQFHGSEA